VTAKAVERTAESIGKDIEVRQQKDIQSAKQLHLPVVSGPSIPYLYVQMDGTQVPVVKAETPYLASFHQGMAAIGYEFLRLATPASLPSLLLWDLSPATI